MRLTGQELAYAHGRTPGKIEWDLAAANARLELTEFDEMIGYHNARQLVRIRIVGSECRSREKRRSVSGVRYKLPGRCAVDFFCAVWIDKIGAWPQPLFDSESRLLDFELDTAMTSDGQSAMRNCMRRYLCACLFQISELRPVTNVLNDTCATYQPPQLLCDFRYFAS